MSSSSDNAGRVQKALLDLSRLLLRQDTVPNDLLSGLKRHLRHADPESVSDFHFNALRHRLRASLLTQSINSSRKEDGPELASKLDKEMDRLRRSGFGHLTAFLALIEPLSFRKNRHSSFLVSSSTANDLVKDDDEAWMNAGRVLADNSGKSNKPAQESKAVSDISTDQLTWISPDVELRLIKDLLFVFQGISGTHIKYDLRSESYVVDPSLQLVGPARDLVLTMCEIGWLYNKVAKYISKVEKTAINGLVSQSFGYAIQEELHDYYRLLAVLEQELGRNEVEDGATVQIVRSVQKESARRIKDGNRLEFLSSVDGVYLRCSRFLNLIAVIT